MNKAIHNYLRSKGFLGEGEFLDPATLKCKLMFVMIQLAYTVVTILHVPMLYYSYTLSCVYLGQYIFVGFFFCRHLIPPLFLFNFRSSYLSVLAVCP